MRWGRTIAPKETGVADLLHVEGLDGVPGVNANDRGGQNAGDAGKNPKNG